MRDLYTVISLEAFFVAPTTYHANFSSVENGRRDAVSLMISTLLELDVGLRNVL